MIRHSLIAALCGSMLVVPSAGSALCLTDDGLPASSLLPIVENALAAHEDGSGRYIHNLEIADLNADARLDVMLTIRDESYSGLPVFDLTYFQGTADGWCGMTVASGLTALDADVDLIVAPPEDAGGYPSVTFSFTQADPSQNTITERTLRFVHDPRLQSFRETAE